MERTEMWWAIFSVSGVVTGLAGVVLYRSWRRVKQAEQQTWDDPGVQQIVYTHESPDHNGRPVIDHVTKLWYGPRRPQA